VSCIPEPSDYQVEVDQVTREQWAEIIDQFDDATIYQTWSYGSIRWSENSISHILLKRQDELVAAAQLRIVVLPFFKTGIAYLPEGPLWNHRDRTTNVSDLITITHAIIKEYVQKRGLYLRIIPSIVDDEKHDVRSLLEETGLRWQTAIPGYRTFLVDVSLPVDEIRKSFRGNWRGHLNKAEKNDLEIVQGDSDELYLVFTKMYKEMHQRKRFKEQVDVDEFRDIQHGFKGHHKLRIFLCKHIDEPIAAIVVSTFGNKSIYLLGATGSKGMKLQGSYLLHWKAIEWMKMREKIWYDLGGIDPEVNKGTYDFKAGLSGKAGKDVCHVGQFDLAPNLFVKFMIRIADRLRQLLQ